MSGIQYPTPPPRSPWSSPVVIGAIVAGVLVLALAILLGFLLIPADESTPKAEDSSTTTSPPVSTLTVTAEPSTVTATTTTSTPTTTTSTSVGPLPDVPGTDQQGFVSGPRCNATEDQAIMVGQTDVSKVVVCEVGNQSGRYYYKGLANGLGVEIPDPTRSGNRFEALNRDTVYEMTPSSLTITTNGVVVSREPMLAYWTD